MLPSMQVMSPYSEEENPCWSSGAERKNSISEGELSYRAQAHNAFNWETGEFLSKSRKDSLD
jgi:hypothetical protein